MAHVLFDTSVLIDLLRRRPKAVDGLRDVQRIGDVPFVCAVSIEEVTRGLRSVEDDDAIELFEGLRLAPLGLAEGRLAGFWRRSFARRGRTLHQADCLIGAAAIGVGARLATGNPKDFPMKGIEIDHWPPGE
jgi:predicted nucleic acid-binding protein